MSMNNCLSNDHIVYTQIYLLCHFYLYTIMLISVIFLFLSLSVRSPWLSSFHLFILLFLLHHVTIFHIAIILSFGVVCECVFFIVACSPVHIHTFDFSRRVLWHIHFTISFSLCCLSVVRAHTRMSKKISNYC